MNKYTFKISHAYFKAPSSIVYDEVQHKIINEDIEEIRFIVLGNDLKESEEKSAKELIPLIGYNFGDRPNINFYVFQLKLIEVEIQ